MNSNSEPPPGSGTSAPNAIGMRQTPLPQESGSVIESATQPAPQTMRERLSQQSSPSDITPTGFDTVGGLPPVPGVEIQELSRWQRIKDRLEAIKNNIVDYYGPKDKNKKFYIPGIGTGVGITTAAIVTNPLFVAPVTAGLAAARLDVAYVGYRSRQNQRVYSGDELVERMDSLQKRHPFATKNIRHFLAGATVGHVGSLLTVGSAEIAANALDTNLGHVAGDVKDAVTEAPDKAGDVASDAYHGTTSAIGDVGSTIKDTASDTYHGTTSAIGDAGNYVTDKVSDTYHGTTGALGDATNYAEGKADAALDKTTDAYHSTLDSVKDTTSNITDTVHDAILGDNTDPSTNSPYTTHEPLGTVQQIDVGSTASDAYHGTTSAIGDAANYAEGKADAALDKTTNTVSDAYHSTAHTIDKATDTTMNKAGDIKDATVDKAGATLDKTTNTATDAYHSTTGALGDAADKVQDMATDLKDTVVDKTDAASNAVTQQYHDVVADVKDAGHDVGNFATDQYHTAVDKGKDAASATGDFVKDKYTDSRAFIENNKIPVAAAAGGLVVGAGIEHIVTRNDRSTQEAALPSETNVTSTTPPVDQASPQQATVNTTPGKRPNWFARTFLRRK